MDIWFITTIILACTLIAMLAIIALFVRKQVRKERNNSKDKQDGR